MAVGGERWPACRTLAGPVGDEQHGAAPADHPEGVEERTESVLKTAGNTDQCTRKHFSFDHSDITFTGGLPPDPASCPNGSL
jgi:hypothetical protein